MSWLPEQLMTKTLKHEKMWAQNVKQFLVLISGIETKMQEQMDRSGRERFMMEEYSTWQEILVQKYPEAAVHPWLSFTTGTRNKKISGDYLFRNFQEGLRVFHRDLNTIWTVVLSEGVSGKSKQEVWSRFCYLYWCSLNKTDADEVTPADFDYHKVELKKWVFAFKYLGPCCEFLELGEGHCHEFLANPMEVGSRSTSQEKRKSKGSFQP